jgi:hypothetical protein
MLLKQCRAPLISTEILVTICCWSEFVELYDGVVSHESDAMSFVLGALSVHQD